jgi:transposase
MDASTRFETVAVGALPVLSALLDKWGLAQIINDVVPWEGDIPLGTLVEVLVLNRLEKPEAMYAIGEWAVEAGVADFYKLTAAQLNDDRLGLALERLAKHGEAAQAQLTLAAVKQWRLDVSEIHYDISNVEFYGAFADAQPAADKDSGEGPSPQQMPTVPLPAYGRTKSGRDDVKQIQFGLNVTADGGVPLSHQALDGNAAEARTHVANLLRLGRLFPKHRFLYTADTKLDTPENLVAAIATGGRFLCGGVFTQPLQERARKLRKQMRPIDYCPKSHASRPPEERDHYLGCETTEKIMGVFEDRQIRGKYRLMFFHSSAKAKQQAATRERHLGKIRAEFELVERNLGKYSLKTAETIRRRLEQARGKYTEGKLFQYTLTEQAGKFQLQWHIDEDELARWQELEGVFVLKSNLSKKKRPLAAILAKYRDQSKVEKRFHHMKGPLAVAPMFLKNPERIAGMLFIVVLALTVLSLIERQVRKNLKGKPMKGLYPEGRVTLAPTGPRLLRRFRSLTVVIIKQRGEIHRRLCELTPLQRRILQLLGLNAQDLRTFKRRCANGPPKNSLAGCGM